MAGTYVFDDSYVAAADLSAKQYYAVKLTTTVNNGNSNNIDVAGTVDAIGILQNKPTSGKTGEVRLLGVSKAVSDGTTPIAVGDRVGPSTGKLVKKASDHDQALGIALDPSSADGTIIRVLLLGPMTLSI